MAPTKCTKSETISLLSMYLDNGEADSPTRQEEVCINKSKDDDPIIIGAAKAEEVCENKSKDDSTIIYGSTNVSEPMSCDKRVIKIQKKMERIISLNKRMNTELRQRKEFRNPYFLENVIEQCDYDEAGTNRFGYGEFDKSDFYDDKSYKRVRKSATRDAVGGGGCSAAVANQRLWSETEDKRRTSTRMRGRKL